MFNNFVFDLKMFEEEEKLVIPEGLEGIDEDIAREIMSEVSSQEENTNKLDESEDNSSNLDNDLSKSEVNSENNLSAEADSDNKQVDSEGSENEEELSQTIPYKRFKEVNEKSKAKDDEIIALRQELLAAKQQSSNVSNQVYPGNQAVNHENHAELNNVNPLLNPAVIQEVNNLAVEEALKISGLTREELEEIEYGDPNDVRISTYKTAVDLARQNIFSQLNSEIQTRRAMEQRELQLRQHSIADYSSFEQEQMKAQDFESIRSHAVNEYFAKLNHVEQQAIADAYQRVQSKTCIPQDIFVVKKYFSEAAQDFRKNQNNVNRNQNNIQVKQEKLKQMERHPKVDLVTGSNSNGGTSVADLERTLQNTDWDDIPENTKKMLLGG